MAVSTITGNRRAGRLSNMANARLNAVLTVDLQSVLGAEKTAPFFYRVLSIFFETNDKKQFE